MLVRLVKMTFQPEKVEQFKSVFVTAQPLIAEFQGCHKVNLFQDMSTPNVFFTISHWESPEALENYRHSELFQATWSKTKPLFAAKPEAWSLGGSN